MSASHLHGPYGPSSQLSHSFNSSVFVFGPARSANLGAGEEDVVWAVSVFFLWLFFDLSVIVGSVLTVKMGLCIHNRLAKLCISAISPLASALRLASAASSISRLSYFAFSEPGLPVLVSSSSYQQEAYPINFLSGSGDATGSHEGQYNDGVYNDDGDGYGQREAIEGEYSGGFQPEPAEDGGSFYWACPYSKIGHWSCYRKYNLKRWTDLILHITRVHAVSSNLYCSICFEVFQTAELWAGHIQCASDFPGSCRPGQRIQIQLHMQRWEEIKADVAGTPGNEEHKWYRLFSLLFPRFPRTLFPTSPYWSLTFNDAIGILQEHAHRHQTLVGGIPEILERNGIRLENAQMNDLVQDLIGEVIPPSAAVMAEQQRIDVEIDQQLAQQLAAMQLVEHQEHQAYMGDM